MKGDVMSGKAGDYQKGATDGVDVPGPGNWSHNLYGSAVNVLSVFLLFFRAVSLVSSVEDSGQRSLSPSAVIMAAWPVVAGVTKSRYAS